MEPENTSKLDVVPKSDYLIGTILILISLVFISIFCRLIHVDIFQYFLSYFTMLFFVFPIFFAALTYFYPRKFNYNDITK